MNIDDVYLRYRELQAWVGWTDESARRVAATAELLAPHLTALIDDFYDEIGRHPNAGKYASIQACVDARPAIDAAQCR